MDGSVSAGRNSGRRGDELAGQATAADLGRMLGMDKAHLSRVLARLQTRGLVERRADPGHGKRLLLTSTPHGRDVFNRMERGTRTQIEALLRPVGPEGQTRLAAAMRDIRTVLRKDEVKPAVIYRALKPGDLGWIAHRQAVLYHEEYCWDLTYEALVSRILGAYAEEFDPWREDGWVAELSGSVVGSVFLMKSDDPTLGRLRLLYVEPSARGLGIGRALVGRCIARAR